MDEARTVRAPRLVAVAAAAATATGTVEEEEEEEVVALQQRKRELFRAVVDGDGAASATLTTEGCRNLPA